MTRGYSREEQLSKLVSFQKIMLGLNFIIIIYNAIVQNYVYCMAFILTFILFSTLYIIEFLILHMLKVSKFKGKIDFITIYQTDRLHFVLGCGMSIFMLYKAINHLLINDLTFAIIDTTFFAILMFLTAGLFILPILNYIFEKQTEL